MKHEYAARASSGATLAGASLPGTSLPGTSLGGWAISIRQGGFVILPLLAVFVLYSAFHYYHMLLPGDFVALWSYGQFLAGHPAAGLYDAAGLDAFQVGLGMDTTRPFPFPYPPTFLLLIWPFGLVTSHQAFAAWFGLTVAAFVWAASGPRFGALHVLALLAAPATTMGVAAGQTGFLSGALLIGGMRLIETRPWLGGLLLGVLTYKPQMGLLVPVALVSARAWPGIGAAACAAVLSGLLAAAVFGGSLWGDWLSSLAAYSAWFDAQTPLLTLKPTITANLALLGVPHGAWALQVLAGGAMAALVWHAFRRGVSLAGIGVLVAATALANPHEFYYDLPMLTAAVLFIGAARLRAGRPLQWWETILLAAVLCLPLAMFWTALLGTPAPVSLPVLLAFAAWAAWQVRLGMAGRE